VLPTSVSRYKRKNKKMFHRETWNDEEREEGVCV
jgi:hypothetical protein